MRKKFRIFSTLTAMVLVVIVMCVGIWAASQATITGSGSLSFTGASDVKATVTISSQDGSSIIDGSQSKEFKFDGSESSPSNQEFSFGQLVFSSGKKSYSFTITIQNDFTDKVANKLSSKLEITGVTEPFTVTVDPADYTAEKEVSSSDLTYTVTITYSGNYEESASANDLSVMLTLTKASPAA